MPCSALCAGLLSAWLGAASEVPDFVDQPALWARALQLHRRSIVLDGHSDTTPSFEDPGYDFSARHDTGHMDIPRMVEGGLNAQFFSIWMGDVGKPGQGIAVKTALRRIDAVHETIRRWPGSLALAGTAADVRRIHREGRIACLMGVEGGHIIENDLAVLRMYHRLGVRYLTLTHSFHTEWADSGGYGRPLPPGIGGLSERGEEVVRELNRVGMLVDVSHVSDATFYDALRVSRAPVIASHSSVRSLCPSPRNLDDAMLNALAEKGGVVQINFYSGYLSREIAEQRMQAEVDWAAEQERLAGEGLDAREIELRRRGFFRRLPALEATFDDLVAHFLHAMKVAGPEHVGIGSDFDGIPALPVGMEDCSQLPRLTYELLKHGWSEEEVQGVLGENVLRVMEAAERVAAEIREEEWQAIR